MNEQKISFFNRLSNSPFSRYCRLVYHTHCIPFIQNILIFFFIVIGIYLLHVVTYNSISSDISTFILLAGMPLTLAGFVITVINHTSKIFSHLHSRRNIALFHTLPVNQFIKFLVLCIYVYVVQTIISLLLFTLITFIVTSLYSFANINLSLFNFTNEYNPFDFIGTGEMLRYFSAVTCFFVGSIYFKAWHVSKTILTMVISSIVLSLLIPLEVYSDIITAIIIIVVGIPLVYVLMKKHSIAKVK